MRRLLIACSLVVACAGPNYYDVLGVGPRATTEQIRTAWKAAALRHHPDKNPKDPEGAAERTKRINTAKDVLCDPVKRQAHDAELFNMSSSAYRGTHVLWPNWYYWRVCTTENGRGRASGGGEGD